MDSSESSPLSSPQRFALIMLRTVIGWHFLYEGYYKIMMPAWSPDGTRLAPWTSAGYLNGATGPVARLLQTLFNAGWGHMIDLFVIAALCAIGLSLMLGLFTQAGCYGAMGMLAVFYLTAIPLDGVPHPGTEGNYMVVNKNLIEAVAVFTVWAFHTGRIAGLDLLYFAWRRNQHPVAAATE